MAQGKGPLHQEKATAPSSASIPHKVSVSNSCSAVSLRRRAPCSSFAASARPLGGTSALPSPRGITAREVVDGPGWTGPERAGKRTGMRAYRPVSVHRRAPNRTTAAAPSSYTRESSCEKPKRHHGVAHRLVRVGQEPLAWIRLQVGGVARHGVGHAPHGPWPIPIVLLGPWPIVLRPPSFVLHPSC